MKKFISIILAFLLIVCMAAQVIAATPAIKVPHIELPDLSVSVRETVNDILPNDFWSNWFKDHPFRIDWSRIRWGFRYG